MSSNLKARLDSAGLVDTDSPVLASLYTAALVRPRCYVVGLDGIDIDGDGHPEGAPHPIAKAIWIFGPNVEGGTYYNHYVPSSGAWSRAFADATRLFFKNPANPFAHTPLGKTMAASMELFERSTRRYGKPEWNIDSTMVGGQHVPVHRSVIWERPFCRLLHFERAFELVSSSAAKKAFDPVAKDCAGCHMQFRIEDEGF